MIRHFSGWEIYVENIPGMDRHCVAYDLKNNNIKLSIKIIIKFNKIFRYNYLKKNHKINKINQYLPHVSAKKLKIGEC